jgi:PIN domain nuclease of toxin-antitoxin system
MTVLIDTHVLLWSVIEPKKLSEKARAILEDPHNSILVSAVSFWEISLKYSAGKLDLINVKPEDFPVLSEVSGFTNIPLLPEETASYHLLKNLPHKDPFDKILIRQAIVLDTPLITKDRQLTEADIDGLKVIW